MTLTGLLLVVLAAGLTMVANLLLRAGIDAAGGFAFVGISGTIGAIVRLFMQPLFAAGFVLYFAASIVWFRVVATEPLSLAYPILVSLTFASVTAGAILLFGEPVSLRKVAGLAVILAGILLISLEKA
jgi:multidrug transporter EmrE-like cation transporter